MATEPDGGDGWAWPIDFQAVFGALPTAYLIMTPELVIADANTAYLTLVGRTRAELVGRPVFEAFPPPPDALDEHGNNPVRLSFERARDHQRPDQMPIQRYAVAETANGQLVERYWSLISAPVVDGHGATGLVLQRVEDVSDYIQERERRHEQIRRGNEWQQRGEEWQRRVEAVEADLYARLQELRIAQDARDVAARRVESLADVALRLTAVQTLDDLERVVVGRGLPVVGSDAGAIVSRADDGGWRITNSAILAEYRHVAGTHAAYDNPLPALWTARTGERLLLPTAATGLAYHEVMASVYAGTQRHGWAFFPLVLGGECLGSLAVAWSAEHDVGPDEMELLEGLAAQCAQALQRIRVTEAQRQAALAAVSMSETLQRSLLTQPPTPDSLRIAVRYHPAAEQAQVGGDWYDAFVTAAGSTLLVVGDVNGHDREAAATMGQLRNLLRGIAYDSEDSPAILLGRLDVALRGLQLDTLATAVLARVEQDPEDRASGVRNVRWTNAGHPPPLLRRPDGTVEVLDTAPDLLLGFDPGAERREHVVEMGVGATLLLFTDGLVERRGRDLDDGIAELAAVLGAEPVEDLERLSDILLATVGLQGNDDDIALLVLHVEGPPAG